MSLASDIHAIRVALEKSNDLRIESNKIGAEISESLKVLTKELEPEDPNKVTGIQVTQNP